MCAQALHPWASGPVPGTAIVVPVLGALLVTACWLRRASARLHRPSSSGWRTPAQAGPQQASLARREATLRMTRLSAAPRAEVCLAGADQSHVQLLSALDCYLATCTWLFVFQSCMQSTCFVHAVTLKQHQGPTA